MGVEVARFAVNQVGAGFLGLGSWYWCRLSAVGMPIEPIDSHGPYALRWLAVRAARRATQ